MIALLLTLAAAQAHPLSPSVLRLTETPAGVEAVWRTPARRPAGPALVPVLPCAIAEGPVHSGDIEAVETRWMLACEGLTGTTAGVDGLERAGTNAVLDWRTDAGQEIRLLTGAKARYTVPEAPRWALEEMVGAGGRHLLTGLDHVLFVLGLVLLVPRRRLVHAVTAFTVGHGTSLTLTGLGIVALPQGPIEVAIAASLMVLAAEILRGEGSWVARWPWLVCVPFGLLHGLGFAGALGGLGLAQGSIARSLLGFNLGIELGQLLVVALALGGLAVLGTPNLRVRSGLAWCGGAVAAMWVLERALSL